MENINTNKKRNKIIIILIVIISAILVFKAGVFVGYRRASFSYGLGDNYYRVFERQYRGSGPNTMFFRESFPDAHGAVGKVVNVGDETLIVSGADNVEKTIRVASTTLIHRMRDDIKITDIKVGDQIVVIGSPNSNSEIEATLIRLLPPQPSQKQ